MDAVSLTVIFAGIILLFLLVTIKMAVVHRREKNIANAVVKALSIHLEASEKARTEANRRLVEAGMRLALYHRELQKLQSEKLLAWDIPDKY